MLVNTLETGTQMKKKIKKMKKNEKKFPAHLSSIPTTTYHPSIHHPSTYHPILPPIIHLPTILFLIKNLEFFSSQNSKTL